MKQNIKTWLIHWLGGVTHEESEEKRFYSYHKGVSDRSKELKNYAESLNGTDADAWCKLMWDKIKCKILEGEG